ncbi:MAG: carboxymuconolactone decarboxylase family protein [Ferruginibacter sp.]
MPHINLKNDFPGIRGPMAYRPETAHPLNALAEVLLRGDNTLSRGERELIAAYVSSLNDCYFCENVHGSMAQYYLDCDPEFIDAVKTDFISSGVSDKMKALLWIASSVRKGGKYVDHDQVDTAKSVGATDAEIHDTVLIAAAFCMFNRYVDGLATWAPDDRNYYIERAKHRAEEGYAHADVTK